MWVFFAAGLEAGAASLVANANLVKKVAFERSIVPLATSMSHLVTFAVMLAVLVPVNLALQPDTRTTMSLLPALVACLIVMTAGLSLALAALNVYFRDVQHILSALLLPWFFLTPIFYSLDQLPANVPRTMGGRRPALRQPADAAGRGRPRRGLLRRLALGGRARLRRRRRRSSSRRSGS